MGEPNLNREKLEFHPDLTARLVSFCLGLPPFPPLRQNPETLLKKNKPVLAWRELKERGFHRCERLPKYTK